MKRTLASVGLAVAALALALPASAKTDPKAKDTPHPAWRHTYADALAEAKDRNCVIFATMHIDH